ncbi:hypothetical protein [uncultured Shimia sp.]|uniref:hypothetical protein n=1 Tax=uncultured Shimia sp. TaxID=573152 RepID=UPI0025F178DE|nr:hypothetical protein [uncultured Shimia sp.]
MDDEDWKKFTGAWLQAMIDFQDDRLTMQQAFDLIRKFCIGIDEEITQFACNVVSEIDGDPCDFEETLTLLQNKPSWQDMLSYMNS